MCSGSLIAKRFPSFLLIVEQSPVTTSPATLSPTSIPTRHPNAKFGYSPLHSPGDGSAFSPTHANTNVSIRFGDDAKTTECALTQIARFLARPAIAASSSSTNYCPLSMHSNSFVFCLLFIWSLILVRIVFFFFRFTFAALFICAW